MSTSSIATASRNTKDVYRPGLPTLLSDSGAASQLLLTGAVLPEQFYTRPTGYEAQRGEAALMRAVLEDAIHCFQKQFVRKGRRVGRLAREAEEWFATDDPRWPFSFVNICDVLGLEPEYLRLGLKRWGDCQETQAEDALADKPAVTLLQRSLRFGFAA